MEKSCAALAAARTSTTMASSCRVTSGDVNFCVFVFVVPTRASPFLPRSAVTSRQHPLLLVNSIALEPLAPSCGQSGPNVPQSLLGSGEPVSLSQLSSAICGLACTIQLHQQDNSTVIKLIKQVRRSKKM